MPKQSKITEKVGRYQHEKSLTVCLARPDRILSSVNDVATSAEPTVADTERSIEDKHVDLEFVGGVIGFVDLDKVVLRECVIAQKLILYVLHVIEEELELRPLHLLAEG